MMLMLAGRQRMVVTSQLVMQQQSVAKGIFVPWQKKGNITSICLLMQNLAFLYCQTS